MDDLEVGTYQITVVLTDDANVSVEAEIQAYAATIEITQNSEPYFVTWEGFVQYREKSGIQTYTLPAIEDPEGTEVTLKIVLDETLGFTTYEASTP